MASILGAQPEEAAAGGWEAKWPLSQMAGHTATMSQLGASSIPFWDEWGRSSPTEPSGRFGALGSEA